MHTVELKKKIVLQHTSAVIFNTVSQNLCLAKLNLATVDITDKRMAVKKINESKKIISKSIADLRKIAATLERL